VNDHKAEFDRRDVAIVVVSFAAPAMLSRYQAQRQWPFTILADPQREAYRAFALKRFSGRQVFSPATLMRYWQLMRKGMKREPHSGDDIYQSGGDFLLDRDGNILYAHRSRDPADRPPPAVLLQAIDRVKPPEAR
jgi:predicted dithiol-disulfide oxidoreductase (DUF899 family)